MHMMQMFILAIYIVCLEEVPLTKLRLWIRTHQMAKVSFRALEPEISRDLRQPPCPMLKFMILIFDFVLYWMIHCFIFRVCQVCMRDFDL